jgi:putative nucleotidyltransferase with HDIG domain
VVSLNDIIKAGDRMAAMPASVARVTSMLATGKTDPEELSGIIKSDEVLTAAVLRRANSVAFGSAGKVFDLRQSVVRLGTKNLTHVVMEQKATDVFGDSGSAFGLARGALWRSGVGGAVGAELLAKKASPADADLAYVAGLLRDIGKIALDAFFGDHYFKLLAPHSDPTRSFVEVERLALGFDHAHVGQAMGQKWGLPERLCNAIRYHHEPPAPGADRHDILNDLVHAADAVCLWAGLAVGHDGMAYTLAPHVRESLALTRHEAEREIAHVWTEVKSIEQSLNAPVAQEKSA